MSRGPTEVVGDEEGGEYAEAFRAANRMVNEGHSWSGYERNCCFLNTGAARFADVSATSGLDFLDDARAVATVDWDADGDLDLMQVNRTAPQVRFLRNDWSPGSHWLAVRLQGTRSNRDAIGARVMLHRRGVSGIDSRTLYAGSSFLSQSSKWVHFGLGQQTDIEKLVVRWPSGMVEVFPGIRADGRYQLVEGTGRANPLPARSDTINLADRPVGAPERTEQARVVLAAQATLPKLTYTTFEGQPVDLEFQQPTLLQLWASWCPMCQAELAEFRQHADQLRRAGLKVIALSVDGVGLDTSTVDQARAAAQRWQIPYTVGAASETLLEKLEILRGELFSNLRPYPLPSSFLVDAEGRLRVLYLGQVDVEQVLSDGNLVRASETAQREASAPFPGRWFTAPKPVLLASLAKAYRDRGYEDDARRYQQLATPQVALQQCAMALDFEERGDAARARLHYQQALKLASETAEVHKLVGEYFLRQRRIPQAKQCFERAVRLDPDLTDALHNLATVHLLMNEPARAEEQYRQALRTDPNHARSLAALGRLLHQQQRIPDAIQYLSAALRADPNLVPAYVYLGSICVERGQLDSAVQLLVRAIQLEPDLTDAIELLADALAKKGDGQNAARQYRQVLRQRPDAQAPALKLAWLLATHPECEKQSPGEALTLARRVADANGQPTPAALDVLAAAYADAGKFERATETLEKALALDSANPQLSAQMKLRLQRYQDGQPMRAKPAEVDPSRRNDR